ncbi:hypothetical protein AcV7_001713 [Taiwanofungus camphoratus]|nr:hypothetical protein AcV7_001713 [Antrodia cinnamomea]
MQLALHPPHSFLWPLSPRRSLDGGQAVRWWGLADWLNTSERGNKVGNRRTGTSKIAYPEAKMIGFEPLIEKMKEEVWKFDGTYGADPPDTKYGYEEYSKSSQSANRPFFAPNFEPFSSMHKEFTVGSGIDKEAMRRDAHTVAQWDFDRIIPCHGDVIETGGKEAWLSAYGAYFT